MELNKIYNEDCLSGLKRIPDNSIDLIVSDPPYFQGLTHNGQKAMFVDLAVSRPFFESLFYEYRRVLKKDACAFLFCDWRDTRSIILCSMQHWAYQTYWFGIKVVAQVTNTRTVMNC